MRFPAAVIGIALGCVCGAASLAQTPIAELGKRRAAASPLQWETREAGHPLLGPIRFAYLRTPVATSVGGMQVTSNVYVSCERNTGKIAIELANGRSADDPLGLKPKAMPRLTCSTIDANGRPAADDLEARWIVNDLGDVMARGFWPATLRACASIGIVEELGLPPSSARPSARVEFEISPYARELDAIFAACGEPTAYASVPTPPPPAPSRASPQGSPAASPWITARVTSNGHTNVRAKAGIRSALVARLDPGDIVLVQRSEGEWWRAMSRPGARNPFEGYIRRDRLVVR